MIDVSLIGTGGMMPLPNRFLTSLLVRHNGKMLLIDCGEGTQVSLRILGWGFKAIETICFTHFHADHISGLVGLLLTLGNSGKDTPLTLIGPAGLKHVVNSLRIISPELPYEIIFIERTDHQPITLNGLQIDTLPVEHRMECLAYSVELKRAGKFDAQRAISQNIPQRVWAQLQKNDVVEYEGITYSSSQVLGEPRKGIKISYCTDCRPSQKISQFVHDSDLFVCEGMYGEDEKITNAHKYKHMLFSEAASLAKHGAVKELWLTHFSPALTDPQQYISVARSIFPNSITGYDRMTKLFSFD